MAYDKLKLGTGDEFTAEHTGHIEDGIADAHQAVEDIPTGSAGMLEGGSNDTPRLWTAEQIHAEIARQVSAAADE